MEREALKAFLVYLAVALGMTLLVLALKWM